MPLTPLHLGPGLVFKALGQRRISIGVFVFAQVMMDIEVFARMLLDGGRLHGFTNTLTGATVILVPTVLLGRRVCTRALAWWNRHLSPGLRPLLAVEARITGEAAWISGAVGIYSHWFLDAMMHYDAEALWPFATGNPFLGWLSGSEVNFLCYAAAALGASALAAVRFVRRRANV